jgi:DNA-binding response OmpR family regulator
MQPISPNPPKVLVVDDSWTDLSLMAGPLHQNGYNVITAMDGDEAIEKAMYEQPNCIVLDVILPKQNGFAVCRRLKQIEACRAIPIILISSKNTPQDRHWGMQQGADIYLTKPFDANELLASVRSLL